MDFAGNGMLIEKRDLNKAMGLNPDIYTFDKFRQACILSGCDYLASLPGIGLVKATKVFRLSRQSDMATVIIIFVLFRVSIWIQYRLIRIVNSRLHLTQQ